MRRIPLFLIIAVLIPNAARAQPKQSPQAAMSEEVRQMCRQEIKKLCRPGFAPNRDAIQRCVAENTDRFPKQCLPMFQNN
ncbi:hypothetical protein [Bradyrhizobium cosmicum]|uniref:hypothetical protein n=1 Tax=Bradyrhizobium cosmicum TaxID=1404864 RepID=UPI0028E78124|nr:hypothetical protein [Bradyrhizobium cosmicum]